MPDWLGWTITCLLVGSFVGWNAWKIWNLWRRWRREPAE